MKRTARARRGSQRRVVLDLESEAILDPHREDLGIIIDTEKVCPGPGPWCCAWQVYGLIRQYQAEGFQHALVWNGGEWVTIQWKGTPSNAANRLRRPARRL
jgi:hypothetical protein